jgi:cephalosporin-C deacetylase-like acetyl esterase
MPPYQVVVYSPGGHYFSQTPHPRENPPAEIAFLVRSGRAVLWPVYKGGAERWVGVSGLMASRDLQLKQHMDLGRSIDYVQERNDIDREKLAYYGVSRGAGMGPIHLALEDCFKAAVLVGAGLHRAPLPELDPFNYVSRVRVPVLMLVGQNDSLFAQGAITGAEYRLLGTPREHKKLISYRDQGHNVRQEDAEKDTLSWLDEYLGKVR